MNKQQSYSDLIKSISASVKPEKPFNPLLFVVIGLLTTAIVSVLGVWHFNIRPDITIQIHRPIFYIILAFFILSFCFGFFGTVLSGFPARTSRTRAAVVVGSLCILALLARHSIPLAIDSLHHLPLHPDFGYFCSVIVLILGTIPLITGLVFLTRLAPTHPRFSSALIFGCSAISGNIGLYLICPSPNHFHILVWHFMPILILSIFGWAIGKKLLDW